MVGIKDWSAHQRTHATTPCFVLTIEAFSESPSKACRLVDVNKVNLILFKVMNAERALLLDTTAYEVLIDRVSVGPVVNIEVTSHSSVERDGGPIEELIVLF